MAAAASSLQYCSVGSLMADGRQCCFPLGKEEGGGGGNLYVKMRGLYLALGHHNSREIRVNKHGAGGPFEPRCLPPHDTNEDSSCDT